MHDFYKFGVRLVGESCRVKIKNIQDNPSIDVKNKYLELLKLWINKGNDPKWEQLVEVADQLGFGGLAAALNDKFKEPQQGREGTCSLQLFPQFLPINKHLMSELFICEVSIFPSI